MDASKLPPTGRAAWNDDSPRAAELRELLEAAINRGDLVEAQRLLEEAEAPTPTTKDTTP